MRLTALHILFSSSSSNIVELRTPETEGQTIIIVGNMHDASSCSDRYVNHRVLTSLLYSQQPLRWPLRLQQIARYRLRQSEAVFMRLVWQPLFHLLDDPVRSVVSLLRTKLRESWFAFSMSTVFICINILQLTLYVLYWLCWCTTAITSWPR